MLKRLGLDTIVVAAIDASERLRQVDARKVAMLVENIEQCGHLRQPVEVLKRKNGFRLIAGGHRFAAVQQLGWERVDAFVYDGTAKEAELAEIDENLIRNELNPLDRAVFLVRREEVYLELHPEMGHGGDRGNQHTGGKKRQVAIVSFCQETADTCGLSARTVRRSLAIARKISPEIRARLVGSALADNQNELLALADLGPEMQAKVVGMILAGKAKTVKAGQAVAEGRRAPEVSDEDKKWAALEKAWDRAGLKLQKRFLKKLRTERPNLVADLMPAEAA